MHIPLATAALAAGHVMITQQYIQYDLTYDCKERTAIRWHYELGHDYHVAKRPKSYHLDPTLSKTCQQTSTKTYRHGYDRGHMVASEHMANSVEARREAHYMTNIAPQISSFHHGLWQQTEAIEACYRTLDGGIESFGGLKFNETDNDLFVESHGINTPDYWWKVITAKDTHGHAKVVAWMFPNRPDLGALDDYLVSVETIENQLDDGQGPIPVPSELKASQSKSSWPILASCYHDQGPSLASGLAIQVTDD
ncbi:unnamed protein product [Aphanomyces euteiches]|uniref:Endonuclease n=2 Tax=Aphanomyces euteiches TaxID=100861 RepID=A0A6G0WXA9_9STRA|nr:hypothetical protein Ae201684_010647 [Aphanomyces euteiches]KAH9090172.1 hypothetical protein Ae201684P_014921 [Aphanomyces euteiches]KAH9135162.1 hypothetical protein AeRB84_019314 [Aphanomyces euteiches]